MTPTLRIRTTLPLLALAAAATLAACSGGEGRAQQSGSATVPSDGSVVNARADRSRTLGDSAAPITIHEISDFECPYCRRFYRQTWRTLDSLYVDPGLVQYVWHVFPSPNHPRSWPASEAAFCAGAVGKFWPMHDTLFANQSAWADAEDPVTRFVEYARQVGIDGESFRNCVVQDLPAPFIIRDYGSVARAGIQGTPFFSIRGRSGQPVAVQGAQPLSRFRTVLDSLLRQEGVEPPGS